MGFPGGSLVKHLSAMQETIYNSLIPGSESPLEEEVATHSSILAWEIPWTEESGRFYNPWWVTRIGHNVTSKHHHHPHAYTI